MIQNAETPPTQSLPLRRLGTPATWAFGPSMQRLVQKCQNQTTAVRAHSRHSLSSKRHTFLASQAMGAAWCRTALELLTRLSTGPSDTATGKAITNDKGQSETNHLDQVSIGVSAGSRWAHFIHLFLRNSMAVIFSSSIDRGFHMKLPQRQVMKRHAQPSTRPMGLWEKLLKQVNASRV